MESYEEMKRRHQTEVNNLPLMFAFGKRQFVDKCRELGVTDPAKELVSMGGGGFCRRSDVGLIANILNRHNEELSNAMRVKEFAVAAFVSEAWNRELIYSFSSAADMAGAFGYPTKHNEDGAKVIDWDKVDNGECLREWYREAISKYRNMAAEIA